MAPLDAQHILGHDGNCRAQGVGPIRRRPQQNSHADAADVRARRMHPLVKKNPAQRQFGRDADHDRQQRPLVALENAERQVPHQQNAGNENRGDVAIVETDELLPPGGRGRWRRRWARSSAGSCGLLNLVELAGSRLIDGLHFAGRPANYGLLQLRILCPIQNAAGADFARRNHCRRRLPALAAGRSRTA